MDPSFGNRRKRRVQVKGLTVSINGKDYQVFNLNEYGVGFLVGSPEEITVGVEIESMTINATLPITIAGVSRHISAYAAPRGQALFFQKGWVCGAEFTTQHDRGENNLIEQILREAADSEKGTSES